MVAFYLHPAFFDPIRSLTIQYSTMQRAMAAGQRIFEVIDVKVDVADAADAIDPATIDGAISFDNVTFGYEPGNPVLKDISFAVTPGETVALVGPTGSGKTSTTALAHRFYDVWSGTVRIGGHDVRDLTQAALGRHIAMVVQEPFLFSASIRDNIRFAKAAASEPRSRRPPARSAPMPSFAGSPMVMTRCWNRAAPTYRLASASC